MDDPTWLHLCAVELQTGLTRLPDGLADWMAERLRESDPGASPREACRRLFAMADDD